LVIPRSLAQVELEAAGGDAEKAAESLAEILRRQAASQVPEDSVAREALNVAAWSVDGAVSVLELLGNDSPEKLEVMSDILQRVDWHFDHAGKIRKVLARFSSGSKDESTEEVVGLDADEVASLLEACNWNAEEAVAVALLQKGHPQCPVAIIRTVLHRNDGDGGAAREMLKDFRESVCAHIVKCATSSRRGKTDFSEEDVAALAAAALDMGGWSPAPVLDHARRLVDFAISTKAVCALSGQPFVPAEHIIWALRECGESQATAEVAARVILYGEDPQEAATNLQQKGQPGGSRLAPPGGKGGSAQKAAYANGKAKPKPKQAARRASEQREDDSCSLM
jgi:hypothetical protein